MEELPSPPETKKEDEEEDPDKLYEEELTSPFILDAHVLPFQ